MTVSSDPSRWASDGLRRLPLAIRVFIGSFLGLIGLAYAAFLAQIVLDTGLQVGLIAEAYRDMGAQEFVGHLFRYLTWFTTAFGPIVGVFLFTRRPQKLKGFVVVWTPAWIVADLFSTWMIRFSDLFAGLLFVSGFCLAATFLALFVAVQRELWFQAAL